MTERDAVPSPGAMRMRRSRERRREGLRCLRVELRATEIDALIRKGLLKSETRNERKVILQALDAFLEDNLDGPPTRNTGGTPSGSPRYSACPPANRGEVYVN